MNYFYKLFVVCLFMTGLSVRAQELVIGNAANLIVSQYAELVFGNGMNLVNNSPAGTFDGNIIFKGPLPQTIGGDYPVSLAKLSVQEGALLSLASNVNVEQELNLTNGLIYLNDNNLRLSDGVTLNGTFSETAMVVAEGNGKLERIISSDGSYLFPIGDTSEIDEYTPAEFTFSASDYSGAVLSVNLKNTKHPNNTSTNDYLNRYWSVTQSGISNINCDLVFAYTNSDVVGMESNMVGGAWNGSYWTALNSVTLNEITGTVSSFSDFTAGEQTALKVVETKENEIKILVDGNRIRINSESGFLLKKVEVINRLGQQIQTITPANALQSEFSVSEKPDIYLLRLSSDNQVITKKNCYQLKILFLNIVSRQEICRLFFCLR
ncbi:MAG: hypothetical protein HC831_21880 [Chloroflexia bacterium]|nr:hypothetical protein [Chloroflexia bacterium]